MVLGVCNWLNNARKLMAPAYKSEAIERPSPWLGLIVLAIVGALIGVYFKSPLSHEWWPSSFYPLFWFLMGAGGLFGLVQVGLCFVPRSWRRRLPPLTRHRMHFTREGGGYLVIMVVCFVGASMTQSNPLLLVFAAMAGPFIVNGSVTYAMLKNMRVVRRPPRRVMAGELFSVELSVENQSRVLSAWLMTVQDEIRHAAEELRASVLFTHVARRKEMTGHYQLRLNHRGRYSFGPLEMFSRYPLGLVERSCVYREWGETLVYPRIGRLTPRWKRHLLGATELVDAPHTRSGMFDDEFHHLREYRSGDNPRAIHWRSSARRNELIVREYHQNREHDLLLLVDLHGAEFGPPAARRHVEQALSVVATICWEHRRESRGASLSVVLAGRETWRGAASSASAGLEALFDNLAIAAPAAENGFPATFSAELGQVGPSTRVIAVTTRAAATKTNGDGAFDPRRNAAVQWLRIDDALFAELLDFDNTPPPDMQPTHDLALVPTTHHSPLTTHRTP